MTQWIPERSVRRMRAELVQLREELAVAHALIEELRAAADDKKPAAKSAKKEEKES